MDNKNIIKNIVVIILLIIIIILLYLLIHSFRKTNSKEPSLVPTGNVDIFEINCECDSCDKNDKKSNQEENKNIPVINPNIDDKEVRLEIQPDKETKKDDEKTSDTPEEPDIQGESIVAFDNYKIWDNKDLRIFTNPAFEYTNKIAPGSKNSYSFVIRNNNDFAVTVDVTFTEDNKKNINMQYKLKNNGNYILGSENNYTKLNGKKITRISLDANSQKAYILDWKWVDSSNDAQAGFDVNAYYKLSILIEASK